MLATIFGHKGFIGSNLHFYLASQNWDCYLPERNARWEPIKNNLGHIFYCAGTTNDFFKKINDTIDAHIVLLLNVIQKSSFESLTYVSSTRLYDQSPQKNIDLEEINYKIKYFENNAIFDLSKLLGESICFQIGNPTVRVVRVSNVYSDRQPLDGFIGKLFSFVNQEEFNVLRIKGSPKDYRDYLHIDDLIPTMVKIALSGESRLYNVASGTNTLNLEIATLIEERYQKKVDFFEKEKTNYFADIIDISNTVKEFDFRPRSFLPTFEKFIDSR